MRQRKSSRIKTSKEYIRLILIRIYDIQKDAISLKIVQK